MGNILFQIKMEIDVEAHPGVLGDEEPEEEHVQEELDSSVESGDDDDDEDSENDEVGDDSLEEKVKMEDSSSPQDNSGPEKSRESSKITDSPAACFGSGTFSSPLVKFYFTAACPQLGIEAGAEPSLGGRPAFLASQKGFTCR